VGIAATQSEKVAYPDRLKRSDFIPIGNVLRQTYFTLQSTAEALFLICEMNRGLAGYNDVKDERTIIYLKAENMSVRSRQWV
jgi:hypothetical protein